jgi:hypothetical protein
MRPAAGPLIVRPEPPSQDTIKPPTIAVVNPATGGNPLALAMPRHRGKAIKKTRKPDLISESNPLPWKDCAFIVQLHIKTLCSAKSLKFLEFKLD